MHLHDDSVSTHGARQEQSVVLRVERIRKSFGATRALRDATLELRAGHILGMVGENGSGKSTLVKILSGILTPDGGHLEIGGRRVSRLATPRAALRYGIATVFQETLVNQAPSVLDNVFLGLDAVWRPGLSRSDRRARARAILSTLTDSFLDLDAPTERLSLSQQQIVAIARALVREPQTLVLDEATSALDIRDCERLFDHCRHLRSQGRSILFISHRMEELLALADEVVVIRDGETVGTLEHDAIQPDLILRLMTGSAQQGGRGEASTGARSGAAAPPARPAVSESGPVLSADGIVIGGGRPASFVLRPGTIVGLAGLEGHGQAEFLQALAGLQPPASGRVCVHDGEAFVPIRSQFDAWHHGVAYLPRSRARQGIFPTLSVLDNFGLPTLARDVRLGVVSARSLRARFGRARTDMNIRAPSPGMPITTLSGGNQQKVLLARWIAAAPRVLLLDDPTRGVDVPTKHELHALIRQHVTGGASVVLLSTELEELEELCDEVVVFHEQNLVRRLGPGEVDRSAIISAMFGVPYEAVTGETQ